jgi:hypothetical protein
VRRLALVVGALSLVGVVAVSAGGLSTSAEDMTSFTTSVSVSVPGCPPVAFPSSTLWVRGAASTLPGTLDFAAPGSFDGNQMRSVALDDDFDHESLKAQTAQNKFFTWSAPTAPPCGYLLSGNVTLKIHQSGSGGNQLTAGLFDCPAAAPPSSTSCTQIDVELADLENYGNAGNNSTYHERTVSFGAVNAVIPEGNQLRLKIANREGAYVTGPIGLLPIYGTGSFDDWNLRWGYRSGNGLNNKSRLEITP